MPEPYYQILLNFTPYIQLMAAVDFGLLILESRSVTVKFQKKILGLQKDRYKPILNEAGRITQQCQERRMNQDDDGRTILGLAETIRKRKDVFLNDTEFEKQSAFMPALGLTSGLFCLAYLILVPFLVSDRILSCLYWLEYSSQAVFIGQLIVMVSYLFLPRYRGYLTSLVLCLFWVGVGLLVSLILFLLGKKITWGGLGIYETLMLFVPSIPIIFLFVRMILMVISRSRRIDKIRSDTEELKVKLQIYQIR